METLRLISLMMTSYLVSLGKISWPNTYSQCSVKKRLNRFVSGPNTNVECVAIPVPPEPTPHLPVFRGPPLPPGQQEDSVLFHPVPTHIKVVEGGTAFMQCRLR